MLIDDLIKQTREQREQDVGAQPDLFADFNGIPKGVDRTEFYRHEQNWVESHDPRRQSASDGEPGRARGACAARHDHIDPPYGIKFDSTSSGA